MNRAERKCCSANVAAAVIIVAQANYGLCDPHLCVCALFARSLADLHQLGLYYATHRAP